MVRPRRPTLPPWSFRLVAVLGLTLGCQQTKRASEPPATKTPALPAPKPRATLFDHALLAGPPARPRPDCSPEALMAAARHVGELELLASGGFKPARAKARQDGCPTPEGELASREVKGSLPERISSCMSQDAPFDAEWDMVNSAVLALDACLDCARVKAERTARCSWVAEQVKRAEQSVKRRMGP